MPSPNRPIPVRAFALAASLTCLAASFAGCSLGGGSSKSGGPPAEPAAASTTITVRFASADPGAVAPTFVKELARVSGGRLRATTVRYDDLATEVDEQIARDLAAGRIDVADVAARAWESLGVTGLRAFQSPFLITSEALLDRVVADRRIADPLLRSLGPLGVTGLALTPRGVRYLFADRPLDRPEAFEGARVRINESPTTDDILSALGARPTTAVRSGPDVVTALSDRKLAAVEANLRLGVATGYVRQAPHLSPPLFAKVTTLAGNAKRLELLGPRAAGWIREAAALAAGAERPTDDRSSWAAACGAGLTVAKTAPAQLDAMHAAQHDTHANLDGDPETALAIDRIGLLATQTPRVDPWALCGSDGADSSPTKVIDGTYEVTITQADLDRTATELGNDGDYRFHIANGRYAVLHLNDAGGPQWPNWDFTRDPVEIGSVLVQGDRALFRPETSIVVGSKPRLERFELFRDRLRWRHVSGEDFVVWNGRPWRKVD